MRLRQSGTAWQPDHRTGTRRYLAGFMPEPIILPELKLDSGIVLDDVPIVYDAWGELNSERDNAVVVCHALTGNTRADVWWGPLIGSGKALDTDRYFVICLSVLGSPYGSFSPLTTNHDTRQPYGIDFPVVTIRDTVRAHKGVLEALGVRRVATTTGGSMGGMQALEWAFYGSFVQSIIPVAVGGCHSSWCIGYSEAQRQAIYADPLWKDGRYTEQPAAGLATARMIAMISYRSRTSFEARFGRRLQTDGDGVFAVESYLRYQGAKLVDRFDANCYIHLTRQMDTHDVAAGRGEYAEVLAGIRQPALVVGIDSDVLYPLEEQQELTELIPNAELAVVHSTQGHDAFLMEFGQISAIIKPWLKKHVKVGVKSEAPQLSETAR